MKTNTNEYIKQPSQSGLNKIRAGLWRSRRKILFLTRKKNNWLPDSDISDRGDKGGTKWDIQANFLSVNIACIGTRVLNSMSAPTLRNKEKVGKKYSSSNGPWFWI